MNCHKKLLALVAGVLLGIMALSTLLGLTPTASAASSGEIRQQINALKEEQERLQGMMTDLESQFQENEDEIATIVAKKNMIDQEIFLLHVEIDNINQQIAAYNLLIADKQDELDAAVALHEELILRYKDRIRTMEEEGAVSYWAVLFQANSFSDFLDRLNMIEEIANADRRRLQELSDAADAVMEARQTLEAEKQELETTKAELDAAYADLEKKRTEADTLLAQLLAKGEELKDLFAQYEQMESDALAQIAQKEQEYNEAKHQEWLDYLATYTTAPPPTTQPPTTEATTQPTTAPTDPSSEGTEPSSESTEPSGNTEPVETTDPSQTTEPTEDTKPDDGNDNQGNTNTQPDVPPCSASWLIPCNYRYLSSPFGDRDAPTAGASSNHQGVDLAAPEGTPIVASRSGTVTAATYGSAAGFYVTINHGDGFSSIYMHMTHFDVRAGQYVNAGQVIGYVGKTGVATGNHLHFGISYGGKYYNPAAYINFY